MIKNVFITGASGFLGQYIFNELNSQQLSVKTLGRSSRSNIICDLSTECPDFSSYSNVDIIIHAAGKAHIDSTLKKNSEDIYRTNVLGTINLLKGLENTSVSSFIFISSVSVYGCSSGSNISEECQLLSNDAYSGSKIEAEQLILDFCKKHDVKCLILRLPLIVGKNPPGNLGKMISGIKKGFYFDISGHDVSKSMVLAEDVALLIIKSFGKSGVYNLTDGKNPTMADISTAIALQLGKKRVLSIPLWIAKLISLIGDISSTHFPLNSIKLKKLISPLTFDDSKARNELQWNPRSVIEYFKI
jgi:nucleoside-diphosphate-sugar epimerase